MVLSANEVFVNLGVAVAALLTSYLIDTVGWRSAYLVPGAFSVLIGCYASLVFLHRRVRYFFRCLFYCLKPGRSETHLLMPEVPHAGENHRNPDVVGGGDDFFVSD